MVQFFVRMIEWLTEDSKNFTPRYLVLVGGLMVVAVAYTCAAILSYQAEKRIRHAGDARPRRAGPGPSRPVFSGMEPICPPRCCSLSIPTCPTESSIY